MNTHVLAAVVVGIAGMASLPPSSADQKPVPPTGKVIEARDGDFILIEGDATVRLVRRREANVTTIHNPAERWVVVLVDYARDGKPPDGGVEGTYTFHEVSSWPLGERWSGAVVVDEYSLNGQIGATALGLTTDTGLIQILGPPDTLFRHPAAAAVITYRGGGRSGGGNRPLAEAEAQAVVQASNNAQRRPSGGFSSLEAQVSGLPVAPPAPAGGQPVRVGGTIKTPTKVVHADPVMPEVALKAGIRGMVIIEATIGVDGSVTEARVLRSIPLLDDAAVAAVRQWRFTPTLLNGVPVPVIMTVTVNFQ